MQYGNFKTGVPEKSLNVLKEKVEAVEGKEVNKLEEIFTHLDKIQRQVAAVCEKVG
jgi:hypothetical protein